MKLLFIVSLLLVSTVAFSNMIDARLDGVIDQSRGTSDLIELIQEESKDDQKSSEDVERNAEWMPEQLKIKHVSDEM